ncbi:MAG: HD domain-containing protein [Bacteriovoracia bacterium]
MKQSGTLKWGQIYDSIYGFIRLTSTEERIINSPFFQRLRWIKQLGFASYIFAGAEHSRFAHAIGVCHSADQMIRAIGFDVSPEKLFNPKATDADSLFHKSVRIAAMLHDIGTFPFSHSIEGAYIRAGEKIKKIGKNKDRLNNHEHLGSYIIKNTKFEGGITSILEKDGLDASLISKFIKGDSHNLLANQLLHSDIDADRMDYLIRDAHYTGIKYGHIDRDYILYHLTTFDAGNGQQALAIKENAIQAVEDFLIARFAWYSQVVRNIGSAKFDVLAQHIASYLLEKNVIHTFDDLLEMAGEDPERFFGFNDVYFMNLIQKLYWDKKFKDPVINEQMQMLIYRIAPKDILLKESRHRFFEVGKDGTLIEKEKTVKKLNEKLEEIESIFKKHGNGTEWIVADIPSKYVIFTQDMATLIKKRSSEQLYTERDPIKVLSREGHPSLLIESENSLIGKVSRYVNFIPNIYGNESAVELLKNKKIID